MKRQNSKTVLFLTFLKIGAFTFGGGYAMIPMIQREIVEKRKWINDEDILEIVAIAESTPGPIAINAATFVGSKIMGLTGAILATLGVILPSFIIISAISYVITIFRNNKIIQYAFFGIRAGVLALIVKALISMYKQCRRNITSYIIMAISFVLVAVFKINVLIVIVICALFGLLSYLYFREAKK